MRFVTSVLLITFFLSGCAQLSRSAISYPSGSSGRLFIWKSNYSAGVGTDDKMCVQGALTEKARSGSVAADIAEYVDAGATFGENVVVLNPGNAQTTFTNGAYFALCQLVINNPNLTPEQITQMYVSVAKSAPQIGLTNTGTLTLTSPEIVNVVKDVLQQNGVLATKETVEGQIETAIDSK